MKLMSGQRGITKLVPVVIVLLFFYCCSKENETSLNIIENSSLKAVMIFDYEDLEFELVNDFFPNSVHILVEPTNESDLLFLKLYDSENVFIKSRLFITKTREKLMYDYSGDSEYNFLKRMRENCDIDTTGVSCSSLSIKDHLIDSVIVYTIDKYYKLPFSLKDR